MDDVREGQIYRHFKGAYYKILTDVALDCTATDKYVVYKRLNPALDQVWIRPLDEFLSDVDAEKFPKFAGQKRFVRVEDLENELTDY